MGRKYVLIFDRINPNRVCEPSHFYLATQCQSKVNNTNRTNLGKSNLGTHNLIYMSPNLNYSEGLLLFWHPLATKKIMLILLLWCQEKRGNIWGAFQAYCHVLILTKYTFFKVNMICKTKKNVSLSSLWVFSPRLAVTSCSPRSDPSSSLSLHHLLQIQVQGRAWG